MNPERSTAHALMDQFAAATGLDSDTPSRRYLWTDAFAVCNWVGLGELDRARRLVHDVHRTLGRHRDDDPRDGWISGLDEDEGARRPTAGGLRIGKPLPERGPDEPYHPQLEWERDGQYFHYLTRWMRALDRLAGATGDAEPRRWALELARVAYDRFSHGIGPLPNRLYWKMSIDLSRPLVPSMGQHDPLDGYVIMSRLAGATERGALGPALDGLHAMGAEADWATDDPLGAGSLLTDAWFLATLPDPAPERDPVLDRVVRAAARSLRDIRDARLFDLPPSRRLAFRELGLAIGLSAAERLNALPDDARPGAISDPARPGTHSGDARAGTHSGDARAGAPDARAGALADDLRTLREMLPLRDRILESWLDPRARRAETWTDHEDINSVMLATAVDPRGYLDA